jgi:hypothetical protein
MCGAVPKDVAVIQQRRCYGVGINSHDLAESQITGLD